MDINEHIYFWFDEIYEKRNDNSLILEGKVFDEEMGFGKYNRYYSGKVICLSKNYKVVEEKKISAIHISRVGLKWSIDGGDRLPEIPFLLTSNESLEWVYDGEIQLDTSAEMEKTILKYPIKEFAIYSSNSIGIIKHNHNNYFDIIVFAEKNIEKDTIKNENFYFSEWDWKIGEIVKIA